MDTARTTPAYARDDLERRYAVLLELYNATRDMTRTIGHPEATVADEARAELRYEAAYDAARRVIG